jgi:CO dehydrogenase/acetyl-CoA synthase gamma subunit (corrinoid Fe-S protein)
MLRADLYEGKIEIESYISPTDCRACGFFSREEFLEKLRSGRIKPSNCKMAKMRFLSLLWAVRPNEILPEVEVLQLPAPGPTGLFPINHPGQNSPILVSGNSTITGEVLTAVLSTTLSPFWYLVVDTDGHTVDMAIVYKVMTADRVMKGISRESVDQIAPGSALFLPGFAAAIRDDLTELSGRSVNVGPVCAAELPLFFGEEYWKVA